MFIVFKVFSIQGKQVKSYAEVANVSEDKILAREFWMVKSSFQPQSIFLAIEECQLSHTFPCWNSILTRWGLYARCKAFKLFQGFLWFLLNTLRRMSTSVLCDLKQAVTWLK